MARGDSTGRGKGRGKGKGRGSKGKGRAKTTSSIIGKKSAQTGPQEALASLLALAGTAAAESGAAGARLKALGALQKQLLDPALQPTHVAAGATTALWPLLEQLLFEGRNEKVRTACAGVLGCLGSVLGTENGVFIEWGFAQLGAAPDAASAALASEVMRSYLRVCGKAGVDVAASVADVVHRCCAFLGALQHGELLLPVAEFVIDLCELHKETGAGGGRGLEAQLEPCAHVLLDWCREPELPTKSKRAVCSGLSRFGSEFWGGAGAGFAGSMLLEYTEHVEEVVERCSDRGSAALEPPPGERESEQLAAGVADVLRCYRGLVAAQPGGFEQAMAARLLKQEPGTLGRVMARLIALPDALRCEALASEECNFVLALVKLQDPALVELADEWLLDRISRPVTRGVELSLLVLLATVLKQQRSGKHYTLLAETAPILILVLRKNHQRSVQQAALDVVGIAGPAASEQLLQTLCAELEEMLRPNGFKGKGKGLADWNMEALRLLAQSEAARTQVWRLLAPRLGGLAAAPKVQMAAIRTMRTVHAGTALAGISLQDTILELLMPSKDWEVSSELRRYALKWLQEEVTNSASAQAVSPAIMAILVQQVRSDPKSQKGALESLRQLISGSSLSTPQMCDLANTVALIDSPDADALLAVIGPALFIDNPTAAKVLRERSALKRMMMEMPASARNQDLSGKDSFRGSHMTQFFKFVSSGRCDSDDWLEKVMQESLTDDAFARVSDELAKSLFVSGQQAQQFLLSLESARYLIVNRLKSPVGGPMQTFEAIERMLKAVAPPDSPALRRQSSSGGGISMLKREEPTKQPRVETVAQVQMLMQFVDLLEMHIHNAQEGSTNLEAPSQNSRGFFRQNRRVSTDWFVRIRPLMASVSCCYGLHEAAVNYAIMAVKTIARSKSTSRAEAFGASEYYLVLAAHSLVSSRASDALSGLSAWSRRVFGNDLAPEKLESLRLWMQAATWHADGNFEAAIQWYTSSLDHSSNLETMSVRTIEFIVNNTTQCFIKLNDWQGLATWTSDIKARKIKFAGTKAQAALDTYEDLNFLSALCEFGAGDVEAAAAYLDVASEPAPTGWSTVDDMLRKSQFLSFQAEVAVASGDHLAIEYVDAAKKIISDPLRVAMSGSAAQCLPFITQSRCLDLLSSSISKEGTLFDDALVYSKCGIGKLSSGSAPDVGEWLSLSRTVEVAAIISPPTSSLPAFLLELSSVARKQQNFELAGRLLERGGHVPGRDLTLSRALLLYEQGSTGEAVRLLWNGSVNAPEASESSSMVKSKSMLQVAHWLSRDPALWKPSLQAQGFATKDAIDARRVCFEQATRTAPNHPNAWFEFALWCYKEGRRAETAVRDSGVTDLLTAEELGELDALLEQAPESAPVDIDSSLSDAFASLGGVLVSSIDASALDAHTWVTPAVSELIMRLHREVRKRTLEHFKKCTHAYFRYLHESSTARSLEELSPGDGPDTITDGNARDISATLRLLRLLVKYGDDLQAEFSEGFSETPIMPWRAIVPQLFARIAHPGEFARRQVQALITRIGEDSPRAVLYATMQGSASASTQQFVDPTKSALAARYPELMSEAAVMIREMSRIALLWDEQWINILQELQLGVLSRINTLKTEIERVHSNQKLQEQDKSRILREKYSAMMRPIVVALDRVHAATNRAAETAHEQLFERSFGPAIVAAIAGLKQTPPEQGLLAYLDTIWKPFAALLSDLKRSNAATNSAGLTLDDITHNFVGKISSIDLPGLPVGAERAQVAGFAQAVTVLPTKTRPKKIQIVGSDGLRHTYLLKGGEDLHLDERIMQFLGIVSTLLSSDSQSRERSLRARHYAVVPLDTRSGLIRWVDNTAPMSDVFRQWHSGRVADRQAKLEPSGAVTPPPKLNWRPSELFFAKLIPALQSRGIPTSPLPPRKEWPREVLLQVLSELSKETPRDLLAKELWCTSSSQSELWHKTRTFARSSAVMSAVGFVIGLGDRHLDNMLIDYSTGELIHIDYNVCFDKGLRLRVPELVPFRLTQNMQQALGATGVEGHYRIACEKTMSVLRRSKETLLTLLETFVHDPFVDWTTTYSEARKELEIAVGFRLVASRMDEMKSTLTQFYQKLAKTLPRLGKALSKLCNQQAEAASLEAAIGSNKLRVLQLQATYDHLSTQESSHRSTLVDLDLQSNVVGRNVKSARDEAHKLQASCNSSCAVYATTLNTISALRFPAFAVQQDETWLETVLTHGAAIGDLFVNQCMDLNELLGRASSRQQSCCRNLGLALTAYGYCLRLASDDYRGRSREYEWSRLLADAMSSPEVESLGRVAQHGTRAGIEHRAEILHSWVDSMEAFISSQASERDQLLQALRSYDGAHFEQAKHAAHSALNGLQAQQGKQQGKQQQQAQQKGQKKGRGGGQGASGGGQGAKHSSFAAAAVIVAELSARLGQLAQGGAGAVERTIATATVHCVTILSAVQQQHELLPSLRSTAGVAQSAAAFAADFEEFASAPADGNDGLARSIADLAAQSNAALESYTSASIQLTQQKSARSGSDFMSSKLSKQQNAAATLIGSLHERLNQVLSSAPSCCRAVQINRLFVALQKRKLEILPIEEARLLLSVRKISAIHGGLSAATQQGRAEVLQPFLSAYTQILLLPNVRALADRLLDALLALTGQQTDGSAEGKASEALEMLRRMAAFDDSIDQFKDGLSALCSATSSAGEAAAIHAQQQQRLQALDTVISGKRHELDRCKWINDDLLRVRAMAMTSPTADAHGGGEGLAPDTLESFCQHAASNFAGVQFWLPERRSLVQSLNAARNDLGAVHAELSHLSAQLRQLQRRIPKQPRDTPIARSSDTVSRELATRLQRCEQQSSSSKQMLSTSGAALAFEAKTNILSRSTRELDEHYTSVVLSLQRALFTQEKCRSSRQAALSGSDELKAQRKHTLAELKALRQKLQQDTGRYTSTTKPCSSLIKSLRAAHAEVEAHTPREELTTGVRELLQNVIKLTRGGRKSEESAKAHESAVSLETRYTASAGSLFGILDETKAALSTYASDTEIARRVPGTALNMEQLTADIVVAVRDIIQLAQASDQNGDLESVGGGRESPPPPPDGSPNAAAAENGAFQVSERASEKSGLRILQRIGLKLDGVVPQGRSDADDSRRLPVPAQVSALISSATDASKVAAMFEGWAAWC